MSDGTTEQRLRLLLTEEHPCSYLDNKQARTAFIDPEVAITKDLASSLNRQGFRRSGQYLYRAQCDDCVACQPIRVPVAEFKPTKSQKRALKKNPDLKVQVITKEELDQEQQEHYFELYQRYISTRHSKGDMFPPNKNQFDGFIGKLYDFSRMIEFYLNDELVMVSLCDELYDGLSAIYTFFEPSLHSRGLGVYAILWQIQYSTSKGYPYLYLGFWIKDCEKMAYKSKYRPNELYANDIWQPFEN